MQIRWHTDPAILGEPRPKPEWPEDWPVPRVGDSVTLADGSTVEVTCVAWYPYGEDDPDPFVYVVLH